MYYRKILREMNNAGEFNGGFKSLTGAALAFSLNNMYLGNSTGAARNWRRNKAGARSSQESILGF